MLNTNPGGIDPGTRTFTQYAGAPSQGGNPTFPLGVLQGGMQTSLPGGRPGIGLSGQAPQQQRGYAMPNQPGVQQYGQARAGLTHTMMNGLNPNLSASALAARVQHQGGLVNPNLASAVRPTLDRAAAGNLGLQSLGASGVGNTQSLAGLSWPNTPPSSINMLAGSRAMGSMALNQFGGGLSIQNTQARLNPPGALGSHLLQPGIGGPAGGYNLNPSQDLLAIISKQTAAGRTLGPNPTANVFGQQQLGTLQVSAASNFNTAAAMQQNLNAAAAAAAAAAQNDNEQPAFDPSEFPSLGGAAGRQTQTGLNSEGMSALGSEAYPGLRKPGQHSEFSIQTEDFPALPGAAAAGNRQEVQQNQAGGANQVSRFPHLGGLQHDHLGSTDPSRSTFPDGLSGQGYPDMLRLHQQRQLQQSLKAAAGSTLDSSKLAALQVASQQQAQQQQAEMRFGLLGLLSVIRMTDPDLTMLALGVDLTSLGLNLNSSDNLYKCFVSPLADNPIVAEPEFDVPACYKHRPPQLQPGFLNKFKEETLFYVFYSMPQDEAQLIAADELSVRGWWFHKVLKCWLYRVPATPVQKTPRGERGSWLLFDTQIWDVVRKDDVEIAFEDLETPPRLKRPPSSQR